MSSPPQNLSLNPVMAARINDPTSWTFTVTETSDADSKQKVYGCLSRASFVESQKLYGRTVPYAKRVIDAYAAVRAGRNLGVLMVGEKGTGKSSLAQKLSIEARERLQIPTVVVTGSYSDPAFLEFIATLPDCVLLFDEFEKVYPIYEQDKLLSMFQGHGDSGKLILLTANHEQAIHPMFISRPGRIRYRIVYTGLDEGEIREYANDHLKDKSRISDIVMFGGQVSAFTYDQLSALIAEMNDYPDKSVDEIVEILNIVRGERSYYRITARRGDDELMCVPDTLYGDPLKYKTLALTVMSTTPDSAPGQNATASPELSIPTDKLTFDPEERTYTYFDPKTQTVVSLSRPDATTFSAGQGPGVGPRRRPPFRL